MDKIDPIYTAEAVNTGGRKGHVRSSDGVLDFDVVMPSAMGGAGGHKTNPEQLFAAGYAACFNGAVGVVAKGRDVSDAEITARVTIGKADEGMALSVALHGKFPKLSAEEALQLMRDAHQVCPYSRATRNNVEVELSAN